jgi:hypothetical protein
VQLAVPVFSDQGQDDARHDAQFNQLECQHN